MNLKKKSVLYILSFIFISISFSQKTADVFIENVKISGNYFSFEIHIQPTNDWGSSNRKAIGDCSWYYKYNTNAFSNPSLTYVASQLDPSAGYNNSVAIVADNIGVTTDLDGDNYDGINLETGIKYHLYTVRMDIDNPFETSDLIWNRIDTGIFNGRDDIITISYSGDNYPVSHLEITPNKTKEFSLYQNFPNPFNPQTRISFNVPKPTAVTIKLYNINGSEIKTLVYDKKITGFFSVVWDGTNNNGNKVASGEYFYIMEAGNFRQIRKMILIR